VTRLTPVDILDIPRSLPRYDIELRVKTGSSLLEIAEDAARANMSVRTQAVVVPITTGRGMIRGFSEAVAAILTHIGVKAVVSRRSDLAGMVEAYERHVDLLMVADDERFVAINMRTRRVVDNAASTAKAYVAALGKMANGLAGKHVLVIGAGNVGSAAISDLILRKANPLAVDIDSTKLNALKRTFGRKTTVIENLPDALRETNLIINTAPARKIIAANMIKEDTLISAPAIPVGLTDAAIRKLGRNLVHDPLQLGVATMAVEAAASNYS